MVCGKGACTLVSPADRPPKLSFAAMSDQRLAITHVLTVWPHIATLREVTLARRRPLTPDDLTAAKRLEAETLAADLSEAGGLSRFMSDFMHAWADLPKRERLQAAWRWECAAEPVGVSVAA